MMNNRYICKGKRKDNGEWVEGYLIQGNKTYIATIEAINYMVVSTPFMASIELVEVIPKTVGQCTGRKYANDKLLFEGDIVEWYSDYDDTWGYSHTAECCGVIVWNTNDYCWNIKVNNELIPFNDYDWDISMVVGNIYDNPELLEVER